MAAESAQNVDIPGANRRANEDEESLASTPTGGAATTAANTTRDPAPTQEQADLGRGRAPRTQSVASSFMTANTSSSVISSPDLSSTLRPAEAAIDSNTGHTTQSAQSSQVPSAAFPSHSKSISTSRPPAGMGHRSMPSTSRSLTFSEGNNVGANTNTSGTPATAAGHYTDADSLFSGDEEGQAYNSQRQQQQQSQQNARQRVPLQHANTSVTGSRLVRPGAPGQLRPPSVAMLPGNKGKLLRARSRSQMRGDTSSSDNDDSVGRPKKTGVPKDLDDSVNVLPVAMLSAKNADMEDDAVERRDRGEELVRRRARERKREKKAAEKRERKRRDDEVKKDQGRQAARTQKYAATQPNTAVPSGHRESVSSDLPLSSTSYEDRPSLSRRSTGPTVLSQGNQSRSQILSREPSGSTAVPYSPQWPPPPSQPQTAVPQYRSLSAVTPQSPFFPRDVQGFFPGPQSRNVSYAPSDVFSEAERDAERAEEKDRVPDLEGRDDASAAWRDEVARSAQEDGGLADANDRIAAGANENDDEEGVEPDEEEEEEDEDEEDSNEDVEYTLKDRQDAINIEHPFGLPIWKPALYKKNRSVTRNAEEDLHSAPSSAAEWHLLPGNIAWTLLFGWWMALIFILAAAALAIVPFGGAKYGRVMWELASYIFWPFGKYVERVDESGAEEYVKGWDEETDNGDGDETAYEDENDRSPQQQQQQRPDIENAGSTWGRSSGRSVGSTGTIKHTASRDLLSVQGPSSAPPTAIRTSYGDTSLLTPDRGNKRSVSYAAGTTGAEDSERTALLNNYNKPGYGSSDNADNQPLSSGSETEVAENSPDLAGKHVRTPSDSSGYSQSHFRVRALGRLCYWAVFYMLVAPILLLVCILNFGLVFSVPMAKLLWILIRNLGQEPLALHFRSPSPHYSGNNNLSADASNTSASLPYLEAGQPAPRHSKKTYEKSRNMGRLIGPNSTIILCTYKAIGLKYYKYTIDGVNIVFINLLPIIAFVIFDFFVIEKYVERNHIGGFLAFISSQAMMFVLALLSVIPLSYFIGMAVASISAQSSIGMGAVINATFGSIIEIILYSIALTQGKGQLVEGSIVGSLLAGVLLMPGLSMIGGAFRRKEQRFNAKSAGVTSTMLIMAIIGILTPTLFYEIYGTFQLTCAQCPPEKHVPDHFTCGRCFYEHVDPVDDSFYKDYVKGLSYYCAVLLVLSYLIGLWFSLRTHASQIWQNQQPSAPPHTAVGPLHSALPTGRIELPHRNSMYKRLQREVSQLLPKQRHSQLGSHSGDTWMQQPGHFNQRSTASMSTPLGTPGPYQRGSMNLGQKTPQDGHLDGPMQLPAGMTAEEVNRAFEVVAATASAFHSQQHLPSSQPHSTLRRQPSHMHEREISKGQDTGDSDGHGGHDAPNWSRLKSYSVLLGCTALYAVISEILVDVVDVVLDGSGIPEKFLGITLFALVPNTTEFMNAISFAMNGNIALSMEIGSAYAIQVCLLQIPAMIAFTYYYSIGKDSMVHRAFTLIFPRWDAISIMFSVFLLTYTYIEARANYYRGSILVLSYLVLMGGFYAAPANLDTEDDPLILSLRVAATQSMPYLAQAKAIFFSIFSR